MRHRDTIRDDLSDKKPLTVGAIAGKESLQVIPAGCDVVELRLDSLEVGADLEDFARNSPLPLLVTARGRAEGGQRDWSIAERAAAYRALLPYSSLIDIELRDFDELEDVITEARDAGVIVIGSFHDFEKTPSAGHLLGKIDPRADLVKFALMVNSAKDITIHLDLVEALSATPFSIMGMGPLGAAARPLMAKTGSLLNYGFLGKTPTAPHQWPVDLLRKAIEI